MNRSLSLLAACALGSPALSIAAPPGSTPVIETLRDHVGATEEVDLTVYFVGFPSSLDAQLEAAVQAELLGTTIVDAKPWWIPNIPKFGAADFSTVPAPASLAPELTPPDGLLRYEESGWQKVTDPTTGADVFLPVRELPEHVDDWRANADVVSYVEHDGAYTDVPWVIGDLDVRFRPPGVLNNIYNDLGAPMRTYTSQNPAAQVEVYSYPALFDALEGSGLQDTPGGATLVFVNFGQLAGTDYTFGADPYSDLVPAPGYAPTEVQYPPTVASTPENQAVADLLATVLGGGLSQAKMSAALDVSCEATFTAGSVGFSVPGMSPDQSLCAQWAFEPIRNLLGPAGSGFLVSDSTSLIADHGAGQLATADLITQIRSDLHDLYRFGVMAPTIKANNEYSEAYELRMAVLDLRYTSEELCLLDQLEAGADPATAVATCAVAAPLYPNEITYGLGDVFDANLAVASLSEFNPGSWSVNTVPVPLGFDPSTGGINPVASAQTKWFLRDFLNEPTIVDPASGQEVSLPHPPLYRTLDVPTASGSTTQITASWENGLDFNFTTGLFSLPASAGGLGIYEAIWPEAEAVEAPPYRDSGLPTVKPAAMVLTPAPGGPTGERWGTFPVNLQAIAATGVLTEFSGGGFWSSVAGNEEAGGLLRRDFSLMLPQYLLGKNRAAGSPTLTGVMPDGSVFSTDAFASLTLNPMEVGAPHWCDQFDDPDASLRGACRDFVRTTTTLQAIETLQHGLGYMHSEEPRKRVHFDGEFGTIGRVYELLQNPQDQIGHLLHQMVNMYTTLGQSHVWGQVAGDWNGVAPHAGMQNTMFRSHAREEMAAAEVAIQAALDLAGPSPDSTLNAILNQAIQAHGQGKAAYDDWDYRVTIDQAMLALSLADLALTSLGEPDLVHDPLMIVPPGSALPTGMGPITPALVQSALNQQMNKALNP
ncbi:MAG: hypothetical protein KDA24_10700 [Deltaproteobacteria bacterium]|nr:hypothetical protein [Deltaproteobacteria bacterium]